MKYPVLLAFAALAVCGAAAAAPSSTPFASFGCKARAGQTCFFKIFIGPRWTRIVQLPAGMKVDIPGLTIGSDHYCVDIGKPPPYRCKEKLITAGYNS